MKKSVLRLLLFFIATNGQIYATHNRSAFISCTHISGYTYQITVTTFTKESSNQADRCDITVFFGDGDSAIFQRSNGSTVNIDGNPSCTYYGESLGNDVKKNIYSGTHTFPRQAAYTISFSDPNRTADIVNIPNSVNVPFYVYTNLYVFDPLTNCISNSVNFADLPQFIGYVGTVYESDFPISFSDNDSITYSLANCKTAANTDVLGYTIPNGFTLDSITGKIRWNNPPATALLDFAVKVKKWRKNILVGETFCDFQISIINGNNAPFYLGLTQPCLINSDSNFVCTIAPATKLKIHLSLPPNCTVKGYSEIIYLTNPGSFSSNVFSWTPDTANSRTYPYKITFRASQTQGTDTAYKDYTGFVYVSGISKNMCTPSHLTGIAEYDLKTINIFPNPTTGIIYLQGEPENAQVKICDVLGTSVYQNNGAPSNLQIDLSTQPNGVYFMSIQTGGGTVNKKIMVSR